MATEDETPKVDERPEVAETPETDETPEAETAPETDDSPVAAPAPKPVDTAKMKTIEEYRRHDKDSGSAEVQVALLTDRITQLTEHLKVHKKDFASRRGLLKMVGRRSALLKYVNRQSPESYQALITKLGIRG